LAAETIGARVLHRLIPFFFRDEDLPFDSWRSDEWHGDLHRPLLEKLGLPAPLSRLIAVIVDELTASAEEGRAPLLKDSRDDGATASTGLSIPAVDLEPLLKATTMAPGIPIVREGRPTTVDCFEEYESRRLVDIVDLSWLE
jgi:hypothetical protein